MQKNILVVDDEKHIVKMLSDFLVSDTIKVSSASNGEDAVKFVKDNNVDLIISDIMMPRLNGISLFYEVRKIDPFLQFIIITGYPSIHNIVEMLEAGVSDFIIKPFNFKDLREIVEQAVSKVERWRKLRNDWITHKTNDIKK